MIKVLIIGLGSIGQRHANALIALGVKNIAALRTGKGQKGIDTELASKIQMFQSEEKSFLWNPTHLIISNPTSLHLKYIEKAIQLKLKYFVEKPVSDKIVEIDRLHKNDSGEGTVGYNLRFHGIFKRIKQILLEQRYGKLITAKLHVGQYLPNWHPYEDYRKAYYAKRHLGGGAIRTLSHEVDLLHYLFGKVMNVYAKVQHLSDLEIDVDDVTNIIAETEDCRQVNIHINLLDPIVKRQGNIYFSEGCLYYNFIDSVITITDNNGQEEVIYSDKEEFNLQYKLQMKDFIKNEKSKIACTLQEGIEVQRIIDACELSSTEKREICLA